MADARLEEIVRRLYTQTKAGKVRWEKTSDPEVFQASFPAYAVRLSIERGEYVFTVYDNTGSVVEKTQAENDFGQDIYSSPDSLSTEASAVLAQLYDMARREALNVDEALDSLLNALA